ncbi:MAG: adenylate kinase [Desulfovibrionaceae bacterium]|nr:adenylate kinase [Desulfovibrionaceae bacterium]
MNTIIFGPNGSGKGTQGTQLRKKYPQMAHIESGAIFREHTKNGTELGKKAQAYMDRGDLVPDEITIPMILDTLRQKGGQGWLLDGFPRNPAQAEKLWQALQAAGLKLDYVVEIQLARRLAQDRILGRRICANDPNHPNNVFIEGVKPVDGRCRICGGEISARADDLNEQAVSKRHDIYYDGQVGTLAAVAYFKKIADQGQTGYIELDGSGEIEEVGKKLLEKLA